jgi:hypothetical protein
MERAKIINLVLQGKGGVGKSFASALLAQYYADVLGRPADCVDADPVNATLAGYKSLNVRRQNLLENGSVDAAHFDQLMVSMIEGDRDFIIDSGASSFIPFVHYLWEADALRILADKGCQVVFHVVVTGGYGLIDTLTGLDVLAEMAPPESKIVVWLNEFFGPVEKDGKPFVEMGVYKKLSNRITAILRLPKFNPQTFGRDLQAMLDRRLTFAEAKVSPEFHVFSRQRIAMMERDLLTQIRNIV